MIGAIEDGLFLTGIAVAYSATVVLVCPDGVPGQKLSVSVLPETMIVAGLLLFGATYLLRGVIGWIASVATKDQDAASLPVAGNEHEAGRDGSQ